MADYTRPVVLASYSVAELTAAAACCMGYAAAPPSVRPPGASPPGTVPRRLPEAGAGGGLAGGGSFLSSFMVAVALSLAFIGYLLRSVVMRDAGDVSLPLQLDRERILAAVSVVMSITVGAVLTWYWFMALLPTGS